MSKEKGRESVALTDPSVRHEPGRKGESNKWKKQTLFFIVIDVLLVVVTLAITMVWYLQYISCDQTQQSFCLPCQDLSLHPDDDVENLKYFTVKKDGNETVCCAEAGSHLDRLIQLAVEGKYREEKSRNDNGKMYVPFEASKEISYNKPAALVVGHEGEADHQKSLILWNDKSERSYIGPNMTYSNGRLRVNKTGIYYIYSQVVFTDTPGEDETTSPTLCHYIYRHRQRMAREEDKKILENSQSKCDLMSPSYIGAVFYLQEQDELMVRVSHPEKLSPSEYSNYFGMHLI